jgi:hypothetical protein
MSVPGLIAGAEALLVGIADQNDGGLRLYLGHRSAGQYAIVYDVEVQERVRAAWAGGMPCTVPMPPPECIYVAAEAGGS